MAQKTFCDVCKLETDWGGTQRDVVIDAPEVLHKDVAVRLKARVSVAPLNSEADLDLCASCLGFIVLQALAQLIPGGILAAFPRLKIEPRPANQLADGTVVVS